MVEVTATSVQGLKTLVKAVGKTTKERRLLENQRFKQSQKVKKQKKEFYNKLDKKLGNIVKIQPKKFILERNQATITLPKIEAKHILGRSELFENEYEKERNLLGWK